MNFLRLIYSLIAFVCFSLSALPGLGQNVPSSGSIPLIIVASKQRQIVHGLNFPSALDTDLVSWYQILRGRDKVRFDYGGHWGRPANFDFKMDLTKDEAIEIIRTYFLTNGYTVKPTGNDTEEVIPDGSVRMEVPIVFDLSEVPTDPARVVTFVFELKHAKPADIAAIIHSRLGKSPAPSARVVALGDANLILVTDKVDTIRKLQEFVRQQDVPDNH